MKKEIIICKGLPASGKSTFAKKYAEEHLNYVRVSRDDLRSMCGKYWVPERESFISKLEQYIANEALESGYNIIIDATNLNPKYSGWITKLALKHDCETTERFFDTPLEECISRDKARENPVGESVIRRMYNQFLIK